MADYKNHRRFSLRFLSKDIIPVSIKPKIISKHLKVTTS